MERPNWDKALCRAWSRSTVWRAPQACVGRGPVSLRGSVVANTREQPYNGALLTK